MAYSMAYSMAYQCENQVQGKLWTRSSVNIFTVAVTDNGVTKGYAFVTDVQEKDKNTFGYMLEYLYRNILKDERDVDRPMIPVPFVC